MSIVLIGKIGSGKTTLYNKITKSEETVKSGGESVTMSVFMKQSCEGAGFKVLDTPGFGSDTKKIDHIAGVLSAISQGPLNRIMIVTKFDRTNSIFEEVKKLIPAFLKYTVMITVVITCWDLCNQSEKETNKKQIQDKLKIIRINSVLFFGNQDSPQTVCEQIDQIIDVSQAKNITLSEQDIYGNFDLNEFEEAETFDIELMKGELLEEYQEYQTAAIKLIDTTTCPKNQLPNFFNALNQFSKKRCEEILLDFEMKQKEKIDKLSEINKLKAFQIHNELRTSIFNQYDQIVQKGQKKLNTPSHFSKFIKRCNYCKTVWLKVAGCNGGTVCGKLVDGAKEEIDQPITPQQFEVTYIKRKLEVKQAGQLKEIDQSQVQNNLKRTELNEKSIEVVQGVYEKVKVGGIGCRNIIYWDQMIDLTEDEMNEIKEKLDLSTQKYLKEKEEELIKKTMEQQSLHKQDLEKKIQEQLKAMKISS